MSETTVEGTVSQVTNDTFFPAASAELHSRPRSSLNNKPPEDSFTPAASIKNCRALIDGTMTNWQQSSAQWAAHEKDYLRFCDDLVRLAPDCKASVNYTKGAVYGFNIARARLTAAFEREGYMLTGKGDLPSLTAQTPLAIPSGQQGRRYKERRRVVKLDYSSEYNKVPIRREIPMALYQEMPKEAAASDVLSQVVDNQANMSILQGRSQPPIPPATNSAGAKTSTAAIFEGYRPPEKRSKFEPLSPMTRNIDSNDAISLPTNDASLGDFSIDGLPTTATKQTVPKNTRLRLSCPASPDDVDRLKWLSQRVFRQTVHSFEWNQRAQAFFIHLLDADMAERFKSWITLHPKVYSGHEEVNRVKVVWANSQPDNSAINEVLKQVPGATRRLCVQANHAELAKVKRELRKRTVIDSSAETSAEVCEHEYEFQNLRNAIRTREVLSRISAATSEAPVLVRFIEELGLPLSCFEQDEQELRQNYPHLFPSTPCKPRIPVRMLPRSSSTTSPHMVDWPRYRYSNGEPILVGKIIFRGHKLPTSCLFWLSRNTFDCKVYEILQYGAQRGSIIFKRVQDAMNFKQFLHENDEVMRSCPLALHPLKDSEVSIARRRYVPDISRTVVLQLKTSARTRFDDVFWPAFDNVIGRDCCTWGFLSEVQFCVVFLTVEDSSKFLDLLNAGDNLAQYLTDWQLGPDPSSCTYTEAQTVPPLLSRHERTSGEDHMLISRVAFLQSRKAESGTIHDPNPNAEEFIPGSSLKNYSDIPGLPTIMKYAGRWIETGRLAHQLQEAEVRKAASGTNILLEADMASIRPISSRASFERLLARATDSMERLADVGDTSSVIAASSSQSNPCEGIIQMPDAEPEQEAESSVHSISSDAVPVTRSGESDRVSETCASQSLLSGSVLTPESNTSGEINAQIAPLNAQPAITPAVAGTSDDHVSSEVDRATSTDHYSSSELDDQALIHPTVTLESTILQEHLVVSQGSMELEGQSMVSTPQSTLSSKLVLDSAAETLNEEHTTTSVLDIGSLQVSPLTATVPNMASDSSSNVLVSQSPSSGWCISSETCSVVQGRTDTSFVMAGLYDAAQSLPEAKDQTTEDSN